MNQEVADSPCRIRGGDGGEGGGDKAYGIGPKRWIGVFGESMLYFDGRQAPN